MRRCFELALLGHGHVCPNPLVGAVLVHGGRIIGEGWHRQYGQPHAEVNCINSVTETDRELISKSTLYVSLEPCVHFGKTPPCTSLIIRYNIPNVVIGCRDSFEQVNGKGVALLQQAGVNVKEAVLERDAQELNKRFFTYHSKKRPYIILKWAQSANGFIAAENRKPVAVSNAVTNRLVHKWRSQEASIMVGANTAIADNPSLTTRLWPGKNPYRVLLDPQLRVPNHQYLLQDNLPTLVFNFKVSKQAAGKNFEQLDVDKPVLAQILQSLYDKKINSVLIEGGTHLLNSFIEAGLWDEARVITANELIISKGIKAPQLISASLIRKETILNDHIHFYQHYSKY